MSEKRSSEANRDLFNMQSKVERGIRMQLQSALTMTSFLIYVECNFKLVTCEVGRTVVID